MMDMNNYRGESHVAQQSRRDKLRVQHQSEHLEDHNNYSNLEQQYPDHYQLRHVKYGTTTPYDHSNANVFSSSTDMMSYVVKKNSNVLLPQNEQCLVSVDDKFSIANCGNNWKSVGNSQHGYDWNVNANGIQENNYTCNNNNALFYMKQASGYNGYNQDFVETSAVVGNMSGESSLIHYQNGLRNFGNGSSSSQFDYQNTLVTTASTVGGEGHHDVVARYGGKDSNELLLLSSFGNGTSNWVNRPIEEFRGVRDRRMIGDSTSNAQGLSLSLSSVPICSTREGQFGGRHYSSDVLDSRNSIGSNSKGFGNSTHIPQPTGVGPLGPFTGYATILKNSKFLKPTLQLLDELCGATTLIDQSNDMMGADQEVAGLSCDRVGVNAGNQSMVIGTPKGGDQSGVLSSMFYSSNEISGEGGGRSSSNECYRPECHQKKAKLLYMQEEVCRRYKQYHQQMQMVVSSFESVAGLSAATPYISMALKTVSRHFSYLKHAITDQLRHMGKALGEDLSSPTTGTSSSTKGNTSTSRLKYTDYGFQKHNQCGGSNQLVLFEPQPPVWRPQRGLPERAVALLRAWLFDHFLHPYPTDTDKHMLATQTGLTRNQVSNWFINARVRLWKPMVEEIHILETKGSVEPNSQTGNVDGNPSSDQKANHEYNNQPTSKLPSGFDPSRSRDAPSAEHWNLEKQSRVECQIPGASMDGSLMSFLPYQRGGLEIGAGLGAVSLTLGLRQSAETAQQQQQQDHFRQTFGGQIVHDFVG